MPTERRSKARSRLFTKRITPIRVHLPADAPVFGTDEWIGYRLKEYLTEPFALRAYIRCGGVTYYSSVKRESVCSAVKKAIAADMAYADDPYAVAVMAVCEEN